MAVAQTSASTPRPSSEHTLVVCINYHNAIYCSIIDIFTVRGVTAFINYARAGFENGFVCFDVSCARLFFFLLVKLNQKQSKHAPVNYNKLISNKKGGEKKILGKINGNKRSGMGAGLV